jgi:predicted lipoprotein with Yx(FWY)xxD motif
MKKILMLVCALAVATSAFAAGQGKQISADYSGIVEKYDAATKTLIVKKKDKQGEFIINDASAVELNKAKADTSAIAAGQKVEVEFVMDGAKKIAQKVKLSGAAATK